jgi:hypothetical protein
MKEVMAKPDVFARLEKRGFTLDQMLRSLTSFFIASIHS